MYVCMYIYIYIYLYYIYKRVSSIVGNNFAQNHPSIIRHSRNWQQHTLRYIAVYSFKVSLISQS